MPAVHYFNQKPYGGIVMLTLCGGCEDWSLWRLRRGNRYLEAIKRLLRSETYFRSRETAKERETEHPAPEDKSK